MKNTKSDVISIIKKKKYFTLDELCSELHTRKVSCRVSPEVSLKEYLEEFVEEGVLDYAQETGKYKLLFT